MAKTFVTVQQNPSLAVQGISHAVEPFFFLRPGFLLFLLSV